MKVVLGRLTVDPDSLVLALDGQPLPAAPKVAELIAALGERRGDVLSKEALMERLWPRGYADDSMLWQTIYLARKLLAKTGQATIENLPRRGYRVVCNAPSPAVAPRPVWRPAVAAIAIILLASIAVFAGTHRGAPSPLPSETLRADSLGRYYLHQGTLASLRHAIAEFQVVVHDAPASARGYADLSEAEALFTQNMEVGRRKMVTRATADANIALRIDPQSATAHTALAVAALYDHAPANVVDSAFTRAIALDREDAIAHMYYGYFFLLHGRLRAGYTQLHRATDIDPSLGDANVFLAAVAYRLGDLQTAVHYAREGLGFGAPDKLDAYQTLGYAYVALAQPQSALHAFRQLHDYLPQASAAGVAYVRLHFKHLIM
ncbi:MAG TPA: winged helix-turn-helix domain-containing protein [Candidatus Baltobacteraceae bacterium]|nr:winged helix-turn-helix domain-containing protein [Candidatus Baltobacteraceae bacterium]